MSFTTDQIAEIKDNEYVSHFPDRDPYFEQEIIGLGDTRKEAIKNGRHNANDDGLDLDTTSTDEVLSKIK